MDPLKELYSLLSKAKYYSKSYEEFVAQAKDPSYKAKIASVLQRDGLMSEGFKSVLKEGGVSFQQENEPTLESMAKNSLDLK